MTALVTTRWHPTSGAHLRGQRRHRVQMGAARRVEPALDRRDPESHRLLRARMLPVASGQLAQIRAQLPAAGSAASSGPTIAKRSRAQRPRSSGSWRLDIGDSLTRQRTLRRPSNPAYKPATPLAITKFCGSSAPTYRPSLSVLSGAINCSARELRAARSGAPIRSSNPPGSTPAIGGTNRPRSSCQVRVGGNCSFHPLHH